MAVANRGEDGMKRPGCGGGASRLVVDKRPRMPVGRARLDLWVPNTRRGG